MSRVTHHSMGMVSQERTTIDLLYRLSIGPLSSGGSTDITSTHRIQMVGTPFIIVVTLAHVLL